MKKVRIDAFCDLHLHREEKELPSTKEKIITIGGQNYLLDLCDSDYDIVEMTLDEWVEAGTVVDTTVEHLPKRRGKAKAQTGTAAQQAAGRRPSGRRPRFSENNKLARTCPDCGEEFGTRDYLSKHTRGIHNRALSSYDWSHAMQWEKDQQP
jgi:hypothetical protein